MTERPGPADDPEGPGLAPAEARALESSVRPVAGRGRGATVAAVLIVVAFVVGLVRPWDWLVSGVDLPEPSAPAAPAGSPPGSGATGSSAGPAASVPEVPEPTCAFPTSWRSATLQDWAGMPARVWSAVEVLEATGPDDPAIPFHVLAGDRFTAVGWCAPVTGSERPPVEAHGTLYRIADGTAVEVPYERLEPAEPDSLGELWTPPARPDGTHGEWAPGRYVIRLLSTSGAYVRYMGLELGVPAAPSASPAPSGSPEASPAESPEPSPTP